LEEKKNKEKNTALIMNKRRGEMERRRSRKKEKIK
jgi:hypothetical protein